MRRIPGYGPNEGGNPVSSPPAIPPTNPEPPQDTEKKARPGSFKDRKRRAISGIEKGAYGLGAAIVLGLAIIDIKIVYTIILIVLSYLSTVLMGYLKIDLIPFVDLRKDIPDIFVMLGSAMFGMLYGLFVVLMTFMIHFFRLDLNTPEDMTQFLVRRGIVAVLAAIIPLPLLPMIPIVILIDDILHVIYHFAMGGPIIAPPVYGAIIHAAVYLALFNLIDFLL